MPYLHSDELYDDCNHDQQYWINKHYKGWEHLIRPCIDEAVKMGHKIQQIKAKFGSLRFYWFQVSTHKLSGYRMEQLVLGAKARSGYTCTNCGLEDKDHVKLAHCNLCKDGWIDRLTKDFEIP